MLTMRDFWGEPRSKTRRRRERGPALAGAGSEAASFELYLCCFRCGQDRANFEPALDTDGPTGVTVQSVVIER